MKIRNNLILCTQVYSDSAINRLIPTMKREVSFTYQSFTRYRDTKKM